jgi:SAM-dependent methyltransferase
MYSTDLAYIHDSGFGAFAREVSPEIVAILRRNGIRSGLVLEIGCGAGTLARHLVENGYRVRGFDVSPAMIRLARARAPRATFRVASLADAPLAPCEAIVSIGEVVAYVPGGLPVLRRFFARAHGALPPGGLLVFDFIASPQGRTYPTKTLSGRDWCIAVRTTFNARTRMLTRRMRTTRRTASRTRTTRETHRVRVYDVRAITRTLARCGFDVTTAQAFGGRKLMAGDVAVIARRTARI